MIAKSYEAFDRECERLELLAREEAHGNLDEDNDSAAIDLGARYRECREID